MREFIKKHKVPLVTVCFLILMGGVYFIITENLFEFLWDSSPKVGKANTMERKPVEKTDFLKKKNFSQDPEKKETFPEQRKKLAENSPITKSPPAKRKIFKTPENPPIKKKPLSDSTAPLKWPKTTRSEYVKILMKHREKNRPISGNFAGIPSKEAIERDRKWWERRRKERKEEIKVQNIFEHVPEAAMREFQERGKWSGLAMDALLRYHREVYPHLKEIFLKGVKWGSEMHIARLFALYQEKYRYSDCYLEDRPVKHVNFTLTEEELKLLDKHGKIRLDNRWKKILMDNTGNIHLEEIGKFGEAKWNDFWGAIPRMKWFPERIPELRLILDRMPKKYWGTRYHGEIISLLILAGERTTKKEREIAKNTVHPYPDDYDIKEYKKKRDWYRENREFYIVKKIGPGISETPGPTKEEIEKKKREAYQKWKPIYDKWRLERKE